MPTSRKILTVLELSEHLRVHPSTIYRLLKRGGLPGFRIGSDWRFRIEAIEEWTQQSEAIGGRRQFKPAARAVS